MLRWPARCRQRARVLLLTECLTRQLKASAAPLRGHKLLSQPDPEMLAPWCWQQTGLRAAEALYKARNTSLGEPEPASSSLLKACSLGVLNGLCTHFLLRGAMVPVNRHLNVTDLGGLGWVMVPACLHASSHDFPSGSFFRHLWPVHMQSGSLPPGSACISGNLGRSWITARQPALA